MNATTPVITKNYHIEVPLDEYYSGYCVYMVKFGVSKKPKFYIQKCKQLLQSAQSMASAIERGDRLKNVPETDMFFKIIDYVSKKRVTKAKIEVLGGEGLSQFELLKLEQEMLDKYIKDPNCLNNNNTAYIPMWIYEIESQKFLQWKGISKEAAMIKVESRRKKNDIFDIDFYNAADKNKRGVYKLFFTSGKYYIGRSKLLYIRIANHKKEIRKRLTGVKEMVENDYMKNIIQEIRSTGLKIATCYLIKECESVNDLIRYEQEQLDMAKHDPNCLNVGFIAKRTPLEVDDTVEDTRKRPFTRLNKEGSILYSKV